MNKIFIFILFLVFSLNLSAQDEFDKLYKFALSGENHKGDKFRTTPHPFKLKYCKVKNKKLKKGEITFIVLGNQSCNYWDESTRDWTKLEVFRGKKISKEEYIKYNPNYKETNNLTCININKDAYKNRYDDYWSISFYFFEHSSPIQNFKSGNVYLNGLARFAYNHVLNQLRVGDDIEFKMQYRNQGIAYKQGDNYNFEFYKYYQKTKGREHWEDKDYPPIINIQASYREIENTKCFAKNEYWTAMFPNKIKDDEKNEKKEIQVVDEKNAEEKQKDKNNLEICIFEEFKKKFDNDDKIIQDILTNSLFSHLFTNPSLITLSKINSFKDENGYIPDREIGALTYNINSIDLIKSNISKINKILNKNYEEYQKCDPEDWRDEGRTYYFNYTFGNWENIIIILNSWLPKEYAYEIDILNKDVENQNNNREEEERKRNAKEAEEKRIAEEKKKAKEAEDRRIAEEKKKAKEEEEKRIAEAKKAQEEELYVIGSGTGFFVNKEGYIVTNEHVAGICQSLASYINGETHLFRIIAMDQRNDLALLRGEYRNKTYLNINVMGAEFGEDIMAFGFPLAENLSSSVKLTRGIVSSLSGPENDISLIQIDAAIQPGNSGGPVLNYNGQVVGVASSGLNKIQMLLDEESPYIPENVNFAVSANTLTSFLRSNSINIFNDSYEKKSSQELAKIGMPPTIQLHCLNTIAAHKKLRDSKNYNDVLLKKVVNLK